MKHAAVSAKCGKNTSGRSWESGAACCLIKRKVKKKASVTMTTKKITAVQLPRHNKWAKHTCKDTFKK